MAAATQNGAYSNNQQTNCIKAETNGTTKSTEKCTGTAVEGKPNLVLRKRILFVALALTLILLVLAVTTTWLVVASKSNKENLNGRRVTLNKTMSEKEISNCTHSHTTPAQTNDVTTSTIAPEDDPQPEIETKSDDNEDNEETAHTHHGGEESDEEEASASDEIKPDGATTQSPAKSEESEENNESQEGSGSSEETTTIRQPIYNETFGEGSNSLTDDGVDESDTGSGDKPFRPSKPCGFPWCDNVKVEDEENVVNNNSEEEIVKVFSTQPIFSTTDGSVSPPPGVDDDYVFIETSGFLPINGTISSSKEDDGSGLPSID